MKPATIVLALGTVVIFATSASASSPAAWAELYKRASAACAKASELRNPKAGTPVDFHDKLLVVIDGTWPQPHMKNAPARLACLYDKRTRTAETAEFPR